MKTNPNNLGRTLSSPLQHSLLLIAREIVFLFDKTDEHGW
jgi:hypothetical protein